MIVTHLEVNNILDPNQHGFRKGRSCLTQLLKHYDEILQNYSSGVETDVIYLDFAKAFDKVDHNLLIAKLEIYGIRGKLLSWIKSFVTELRWSPSMDSTQKRCQFLAGLLKVLY